MLILILDSTKLKFRKLSNTDATEPNYSDLQYGFIYLNISNATIINRLFIQQKKINWLILTQTEFSTSTTEVSVDRHLYLEYLRKNKLTRILSMVGDYILNCDE